MDSLKEKMKTMPRVKAEVGQMVIIETTKDGVTLSEVICCVEELSFNVSDNSSSVKLSVFNPHDKGSKKVTSYEC